MFNGNAYMKLQQILGAVNNLFYKNCVYLYLQQNEHKCDIPAGI